MLVEAKAAIDQLEKDLEEAMALLKMQDEQMKADGEQLSLQAQRATAQDVEDDELDAHFELNRAGDGETRHPRAQQHTAEQHPPRSARRSTLPDG